MRISLYILLSLLILSCKRDPPVWQINNLNNNAVSVFGHGGMGIYFKYPINSYESIEPCLRIGADGTEVDVQMTKDSLLILFHHEKLKDGTMCEGLVNEKNWAEIKDCLYASPYSQSVDIIPAEYLLERINTDKALVTFDCKLYHTKRADRNSFLSTYSNSLIKLLNKYNLRDKAFIESSDTVFLSLLKTKAPDLKLFFYPPNFESALRIANKLNLYGITINNDLISAEQVQIAHEHNRLVTVWNLNSESQNMEAVKKNVDHIQSDKVISVLKKFEKYKKQGAKNFRW